MPNRTNRFNHALANELIQHYTNEYTDKALCINPLISVIVLTYNHAKFLSKSLEGILSQKVACPIEIIVGDDCSQDGAQQIAKTYQRHYPEIIRLFVSTKNLGQFTGGGRLNLLRSFQKCRGKYIAYIEGDDFWIDNNKLQYQLDYLRNHPSAAACFHGCITVNKDGEAISHKFQNIQYRRKYNQYECLTALRAGYASASLFFRSEIIKTNLPNYYLMAGSDFLLDLVITEYGTLDYLDFTGCAYRIHKKGAWSGLSWTEKNIKLMNLNAALLLDRNMRIKYKRTIDKKLLNIFSNYCMQSRNSNEKNITRIQVLFSKIKYISNFKKLSLFSQTQLLYYYNILKYFIAKT